MMSLVSVGLLYSKCVNEEYIIYKRIEHNVGKTSLARALNSYLEPKFSHRLLHSTLSFYRLFFTLFESKFRLENSKARQQIFWLLDSVKV